MGFEITDLPEPPAIFQMIQSIGEVDPGEMRTVFNMGIGLTLVVRENEVNQTLQALHESGVEAWRIGHAVADPERRVRITAERLVGQSRRFVLQEST